MRRVDPFDEDDAMFLLDWVVEEESHGGCGGAGEDVTLVYPEIAHGELECGVWTFEADYGAELGGE